MDGFVRDGYGENETLRMLSQTHLHQSSIATNEMHRFGPYRSPMIEQHPQMLHNFPHLHPSNFHVSTFFQSLSLLAHWYLFFFTQVQLVLKIVLVWLCNLILLINAIPNDPFNILKLSPKDKCK